MSILVTISPLHHKTCSQTPYLSFRILNLSSENSSSLSTENVNLNWIRILWNVCWKLLHAICVESRVINTILI